jgi:hypothetical protein
MPWYGYLIIAIVAVVVVLVVAIITGNIKKVKEWLVLVCAEAEKKLGSGTGALKLREVYDKFIEKFPKLSTIISFNLFSKLVDKSLKVLKNLLDTNTQIKEYVEGTDENSETEDTTEE